MAPLIAINASCYADGADSATVRIKGAYVDSIAAAGGIPLVLPLYEDRQALRHVLQKVDGVMLIGGDDMSGERFGQETSPLAIPLLPRREEFDFALIEEALALDKPILAICLGSQALNVYRGGSLFQDLLAEHPDSNTLHGKKVRTEGLRHSLKVAPESLLARIVGANEMEVNTGHHQAVSVVGEGLNVCGTAPDGIVEAIEDPARKFVLGIQWHPEELPDDPRQKAIFTAFVKAAASQGAIS
jgi:putative glutamine amidotransferase